MIASSIKQNAAVIDNVETKLSNFFITARQMYADKTWNSDNSWQHSTEQNMQSRCLTPSVAKTQARSRIFSKLDYCNALLYGTFSFSSLFTS